MSITDPAIRGKKSLSQERLFFLFSGFLSRVLESDVSLNGVISSPEEPAMAPIKLPSTVLLAALVLIAIPCRAKDPDWVEVHSPHFSVVSDAGDRRARDVALRFEQMYFVFGTLFSKQTVSFPVPLQIVAFRSTSELRNFVPSWKGKPLQVAGVYLESADRNFILLDLSVEDAYQVVFHEYAHLLLNGNYPPTQVWFDEGFAEYFSTIAIVPKENKVRIGLPPDYAVETLKANSFFPTLDLFGVKRDSKIYNEAGDHRSMFYAQSWLYVHYLFDTRKLDQASTYFHLTQNQHVPVAEAIPQAFGTDAPHFDKALQDYFASTKDYAYSYDLPEMETMTFNSEKLRPLDAQAILADVHLHSPDYAQKAIEEFQQILAADPNNAAAHRGLGYAYLRQNQFDKAGPHLLRAVDLDAQDARAHYYSADLMNRKALATGMEPNWPGMLAHLQLATRYDPRFADAYDLLAYVQMQQGHTDAALANSKAAIRLNPRDRHFQVNFGECLVAAGKLDDAEAVFEQLKQVDDVSISAIAAKNLELIAQYKSGAGRPVNNEHRVYKTEKEWGTDSQGMQTVAKTGDGGEKETQVAAPPAVREQGPAKADRRPIRFLKGTLVNVTCGQDSSALLQVRATSGQHIWKMSTENRDKLVLVGADAFSCDWKNQKVAVNYRESSAGRGELVSLEIQ
jgi:Flp pilus assembly protein TadD